MENLFKKHDLKISLNYRDACKFSDIIGHKVVDIFHDEDRFQILTETHIFQLNHDQDCCESVWLSDISGSPESMIGNEIILAEESSQDDPNADESATWTFYKLATIKGYVDLTWRGESNGFYSEDVSCFKVLLSGENNEF